MPTRIYLSMHRLILFCHVLDIFFHLILFHFISNGFESFCCDRCLGLWSRFSFLVWFFFPDIIFRYSFPCAILQFISIHSPSIYPSMWLQVQKRIRVTWIQIDWELWMVILCCWLLGMAFAYFVVLYSAITLSSCFSAYNFFPFYLLKNFLLQDSRFIVIDPCF